LALLEPKLGDSTLEHYQPLHAAHAELLSRAGDAAGAARAYERAIALSSNARRAGGARKASERAALIESGVAAAASSRC
jgi:predicted RNA polymerase sigma factor